MSDNNKQAVAIYCRVASGAREDRFEINSQEQSLINFAIENGYVNPVSYLDNAQNGSTLDRPAFSKLVADIGAGIIDTVIIRDLSRISRSYLQTEQWLNWLDKKGVVLISLDGYQRESGFSTDVQKILVEFYQSQKQKNALKKKKNKELSSSDARVGG
jgi:DNA invertase Pin-like site-specific DNA recombinase